MGPNSHSMNDTDRSAKYGILIELPDGDPFANLVGDDWQTEHWFATEAARDQALADMAQEHVYSRKGDKPALIFKAIERNELGG